MNAQSFLKELIMSADTTQGTGLGAAQTTRGPDGGKNSLYQTLSGPHVVGAGHCTTAGPGTNWKIRVNFPVAFVGMPHDYVVVTQQDDYTNNDGRNQYPAHIEKLDAMGNNEDDGFEGGFGGFVLHTGDSEERRFMYTVIKIGSGQLKGA